MRIGLDISVLNDKNRTGIGVYTYNLIDAILKQDREDQFVLFGIATLSTYDYLKNLPFKNYPNVQMKIFKWPAKLFRTSFLIWQKLNFPPIEIFTGSVDVFHSFNWYLPPQKNGKKIATIFDMTSLLYPQWHQAKTTQLDSLRFQRISQKADLVIAISESAKNDFLKYSPKSKVEVVYPSADERFNPYIKKEFIKDVLQKYHLHPGYFLSVATLEPRKNLDNLIKAYLQTDLIDPLVLVGGAGWKSDQLVHLATQYPERIKLTGFVSDEQLPAFYKGAKCLVYPSLYEGFGIPVLEALRCGTAVICSGSSSLPEVGGNAVLYVDPYSVEDIQKRLIEISKGERLGRQITQKGLKQAEKFSWEKSAQKLLSLYRH